MASHLLFLACKPFLAAGSRLCCSAPVPPAFALCHRRLGLPALARSARAPPVRAPSLCLRLSAPGAEPGFWWWFRWCVFGATAWSTSPSGWPAPVPRKPPPTRSPPRTAPPLCSRRWTAGVVARHRRRQQHRPPRPGQRPRALNAAGPGRFVGVAPPLALAAGLRLDEGDARVRRNESLHRTGRRGFLSPSKPPFRGTGGTCSSPPVRFRWSCRSRSSRRPARSLRNRPACSTTRRP